MKLTKFNLATVTKGWGGVLITKLRNERWKITTKLIKIKGL